MSTTLQRENERLIAKLPRLSSNVYLITANEMLIRSLNADGSPFESDNPNMRKTATVLLRTAQLQSVGNWFTDLAAKRLEVLENELKDMLVMDDPTDDNEDTLQRLFAMAASRIKFAYEDIRNRTQEELAKLSQVLGFKVDVNKMAVLGLTLAEHFKAQSDAMALKFKAAVRAGMVAKDTLDGLIERVIGTPELKPAANEITDDQFINAEVTASGLVVRVRLVDAAENSFAKMIQSAIQTVSNLVENGAFDDLPDEDKATMGWEWNALHDGHIICPECQALDGQRWDAKFINLDPQGMEWPGFGQRHFGCLCSQIPVDLEEEKAPKTSLDGVFLAQDKPSLEASFGKANTEAFLDGRINGRQLLQQDTWKLSPEAMAELRGKMQVL